MILDEWDDRYGDQRQELVFISSDLDRVVLESRLFDCLLTDEELDRGMASWAGLDDPFTQWEEEHPGADESEGDPEMPSRTEGPVSPREPFRGADP